MNRYEIKEKFKNKEIQFLNDTTNIEIFCFLSDSNSNLFGYYYSEIDGASSKPYDLPIIKLSEIKE